MPPFGRSHDPIFSHFPSLGEEQKTREGHTFNRESDAAELCRLTVPQLVHFSELGSVKIPTEKRNGFTSSLKLLNSTSGHTIGQLCIRSWGTEGLKWQKTASSSISLHTNLTMSYAGDGRDSASIRYKATTSILLFNLLLPAKVSF